MGLLKSTVRADELQRMVDAFNAKLRKYLGRTSSPWTGEVMATLVTVRWRTPPPNSIDERLIVGDDGHARLDVLRPRSLGDTVGTYEGEIDEAVVAARQRRAGN